MASTPGPEEHNSTENRGGTTEGRPGENGDEAAGLNRARYVMIGGFLGAGKTTCVARLARHLTGQGMRVGLITNDQGSELVDTAMLRSRGFATEEIPGGCFCCRFNSLVEAANRLSATSRPDLFIAEPVGSCTDLVATVSYPLRRIYGGQFTIAPLSVLVDPVRALRVLGVEPGKRFSEKVVYIYRKQLEEADLIVINKCDLLEEARLGRLRDKLAEAFPGKEVFEISARESRGLEAWFARILAGEEEGGETMKVDYAVYAEGEALLGWLNCALDIHASAPVEAEALLAFLAETIQARLQKDGSEVAHLKMTFSPEGGLGGIAAINLVRSDFVPELGQTLDEPVTSGELIINLRAEASPDSLARAVKEAVGELPGRFPRVKAKISHLEQFRPGKPVPTHRFTTLV